MAKTSRWVWGVLLGLTVGAIAPSGSQAAPSRAVLDRVVAVVGNDVVLKSELDRATNRHPLMQEAMAKLPANAPPAIIEQKRREIEAKVLDELIEITLIRIEARKYDIVVTPEDLERASLDVARQYGLTIEELREQVEQSLEYESWDDYLGELRDQILQLKVPNYLASYSVSDQEVREYYRQMTKDESAKVSVVQFVFVPKSQEASARDAAFARAQALGRKLRDGADVDEVQAANDVPSEVRDIGRGDVAPVLEDAIFDAVDGQVVGPLASGKGYTVFKVLEHKASAALEYEQVKDRIRQQLEAEAFVKAQKEYRQQLRAKAHIDIRL